MTVDHRTRLTPFPSLLGAGASLLSAGIMEKQRKDEREKRKEKRGK
jgi:hypothetical protein